MTKKFLLIAVASEDFIRECERDFYDIIEADYTQVLLYDIDEHRFIFNEDTGHENPLAHYDNIVEGLKLADVSVATDFILCYDDDNYGYKKESAILADIEIGRYECARN